MTKGFDYTDKRVVVTGAASGIGAATARIVGELGASVIGVDIAKVEQPGAEWFETNLMDPDSIEASAKKIGDGGRVDALFNCAAVPGHPFSKLDTMLVNFVGLRHFTESIIVAMDAGSAIASVSSLAGMGFMMKLKKIHPLLAIRGFAESKKWCEDNADVANGYEFAKECIIAYSMVRARSLAAKGIRINTICPGITETPMLPRFYEVVPKDWMETHMQGFLGRNSQPEEQAWPLVFLNSCEASYVTGSNLFVDAGYSGALMTGVAKPPPPPPRPG